MARLRVLAVAAVAIVLAAGGLLPSLGAPAAQPNATAQPNILFILTDDLDARALAELPNVRRLLADQGTTFPNFFVSSPNCCPSRASILRGQYAHNHGVLRNSGKDGGFRTFHTLDREPETIGVWMQRAGYRTGLMGKYLNGYPNSARESWRPPGWDEWDVSLKSGYVDYEMNENGRIVWHGEKKKDYLTDLLTGKAADFVTDAANDGTPFFLYLAPRAPHGPTTPARRHAGAFAGASAPRSPNWNEADVSDKPNFVRAHREIDGKTVAAIDEEYQRRRESMLAVDEMVADLVATLERAGTLDQTYILFASDNGFHLGEHRLPSRKGTPYDEVVRIPLIVRGPGVPAGAVDESLVMNIDLAPTFAALGGAAVPDWIDGRSLASLFDGSGRGSRSVVLVEDFGGEGSRRKYNRPHDRGRGNGIPPFRALRSPDLLYVEYASGERELYDRRADPFEMDNIVDRADPRTVATYSERATALAGCARDRCRDLEDAPLPAIGALSARAADASPAAPPVLSLPVLADASVSPDGDAPTGDESTLTIGGAGAPADAFVKFEVPQTGKPIRSATLRLRIVDDADAGGDGEIGAWAVGAAWDEGGIAWATRPAADGGRIGRATAAGPGDLIEIDVTKLAKSPGQYSLVLKSRSRDAVRVWSSEGAEPPIVLVTTGDQGSFARGRRGDEPKAEAGSRQDRDKDRRGGKDDRGGRSDRSRERTGGRG